MVATWKPQHQPSAVDNTNRTQFRMLSNDTSSPNILCLTNTGIEIEISGLRLAIQFSCHHMYRLDTRVFNSTFDGTESSDTALVLNEATEAHINKCSFISNKPNINGVLVNMFTNFDNFGLGGEVNCDSSLETFENM